MNGHIRLFTARIFICEACLEFGHLFVSSLLNLIIQEHDCLLYDPKTTFDPNIEVVKRAVKRDEMRGLPRILSLFTRVIVLCHGARHFVSE